MKDTEVHVGLPLEEVRNLIARDFLAVLIMECDNKIVSPTYDRDNPEDYVIKDAKAHIAFYEKAMKIAEHRKGLKTVMKFHNWTEHDISDDTVRDADSKFHLSFIGSEDEYEELLHKIYPKKKK